MAGMDFMGAKPPASPPSPPSGPRPAMIAPHSPDPAIQGILKRAAAGDWTVMPEVKKLLATPAFLKALGDVASYALDQLLVVAAGDNLAVETAVRRKYAERLG